MIQWVRDDQKPFSSLPWIRSLPSCYVPYRHDWNLLQPSGIRYVLRSFSVRCCISLAYWEGIDLCGFSVYCGTPQAIRSFIHNSMSYNQKSILYPPCFIITNNIHNHKKMELLVPWSWESIALFFSSGSCLYLSRSRYIHVTSMLDCEACGEAEHCSNKGASIKRQTCHLQGIELV